MLRVLVRLLILTTVNAGNRSRFLGAVDMIPLDVGLFSFERKCSDKSCPASNQIPLSGGDRKAQAKELRRARGLYDEYMRQAAVVRAEARRKGPKADQLECSAWNAIMFCGGPAQPSPTIETALNAGYALLEAKCNRCGRLSRADLRKVRRPGDTPLHQLEAALSARTAHSRESGSSARTSSAWLPMLRPTPNRLNAPCRGGPVDDLVGAAYLRRLAHQAVALFAQVIDAILHALEQGVCRGCADTGALEVADVMALPGDLPPHTGRFHCGYGRRPIGKPRFCHIEQKGNIFASYKLGPCRTSRSFSVAYQ